VDLLIVVGMFLTGFDAPSLNTLFVDKNLRFHGLIQAYSRTNRIYDATKTFGNIVTFRDLEAATIAAIKLFGDSNTKNVVLEKSYDEQMQGHEVQGETRRGYLAVAAELQSRFPNPESIVTEKDKKEFVALFGEYLRLENVLQNYDEYTALKTLQTLDLSDPVAVTDFKNHYQLSDEDVAEMQAVPMPTERQGQDYRSTYNDIRDWLRREKDSNDKAASTLDWDDVVFEIDLLKTQEINLDYILELLFEHNKNVQDKTLLLEEARRLIRSSLGNRAKESLIVEFIEQTNLDKIVDAPNLIAAFFQFARQQQQAEAEALILAESLNAIAAKRYFAASLKREYASEHGTALNDILPKMSPLNPLYLSKKQSVFEKVAAFVEKFKGISEKVE
jgi:type I restriction enzyme R subunit